ncbi:MAG: hypothetical protein V4621_03250 [Pseudomonadota bacterium]
MQFLKKQLLIVMALVAAVVFLSSTIMLLIGMLPTIVAVLSDRSPKRLKTVTVGCLNFAACFPFWMDLITSGHTTEQAMHMIGQPTTIIVMFMGAGAGYGLEIFLTQMVAKLSVQQGYSRLKRIKEQQQKLLERWGPEVSGDIPLDNAGFPMSRDKPRLAADNPTNAI